MDRALWDCLEGLLESQNEIKVTLAKNTAHLEEHMRRTEVAEEALIVLRADVEPLKAHVAAWAGVAKALVVAAGVVGIVGGLLKLFGY